jgi:hypothetical protein
MTDPMIIFRLGIFTGIILSVICFCAGRIVGGWRPWKR